MACTRERVNLPVEGGRAAAGCSGETGRHGRGMMDGSHASHCEKIIARCRQLRQRGGRPKPRERTKTLDPCVSEPAEPRTFIFTCDAQELIAVNSCAGCKVGAVVALFYITNTPFSPHSSPFPRNLNQKTI